MDGRARYDEIVDDLLHRHGDAERTQMMGMPSIKSNGKLLVGYIASQQSMLFKLPVDGDREQALVLDGAHLFDPSGEGRPFKEWVVLPPAHEADWPAWAERALTSLAG
jgi:hypothetical protein